MAASYRVVRLLKNRLYPTYQLHAFMANKKTSPEDGLRLAALYTIDWLCKRLSPDLPEALQGFPDPEDYLNVTNDCLRSVHLHSGFVVDIVSTPSAGIWSMQITEPDLGSDPGNPDQERPPVPGRVIETNIGYRITSAGLECGFQTVVSDPDGDIPPADVYRLAIIRLLADLPAFGLKQIIPLERTERAITTVEQLRQLTELVRSDDNQLPCVIFTHGRDVVKLPLQDLPLPVLPDGIALPPLQKAPGAPQILRTYLPYDAADFASHTLGYCRTYTLADPLLDRFNQLFRCSAKPGEIVILEPARFGGKIELLPLRPGAKAGTINKLQDRVMAYPRYKDVDFGSIIFLSAAREDLLHRTQHLREQAESADAAYAQQIDLLQGQWDAELKKKDTELENLRQQLARQRQYQTRLEAEKEQLGDRQAAEKEAWAAQMAEKEAQIAFLERKLDRPDDHSQIVQWVQSHFAGRLILHDRAVSLLSDKSAKETSLGLICDALDFLATDYYDRRYCGITTDEMNLRCSQKYGRPFSVSPVGDMTITFTPEQYRIKYFLSPQGKPIDSDLDFHLRVGNNPENLLRIYFLHDDDKKLIVVGSLPKHLRAVTVQ